MAGARCTGWLGLGVGVHAANMVQGRVLACILFLLKAFVLFASCSLKPVFPVSLFALVAVCRWCPGTVQARDEPDAQAERFSLVPYVVLLDPPLDKMIWVSSRHKRQFTPEGGCTATGRGQQHTHSQRAPTFARECRGGGRS